MLGKAIAAGLRGIIQAGIVFLIALALGIQLRWQPLPIVVVVMA